MADDTAGVSRRERQRAANRKWREANREEILERKRRYRRENADRINERRRQWRRENADKIREQRRLERQANPEKYRERTRKWRAANPEKAREQSRLRAPLRENMQSIHGRDWYADYMALWEAQGGRCYFCGDELCEDVFPSGRGRRTAIDHDYRCCPKRRSCRICRRGLACHRCNTAVGLFGDDPALMRQVADALEAARAIVEARLSSRPAQDAMF